MSQSRPRVVAAGLSAAFPSDLFNDRIDLRIVHTDDDLRRQIGEAEVLYSWQVPRSVPEETPELKWIQLPSAGTDHLRGHTVWESSIQITSSKGMHTVPMAEHTFAMLLALTRQIPAMVRAQDRGEWLRSNRSAPLRPGEIRGKTLGIVGWGKIGEGVAHIARAFGMRVIGTRWSLLVPRQAPRTISAYEDPPWLEAAETLPDVVYPQAQLHDVLAQSDIVISILPLTDATRGSFAAAEFEVMKRGAVFLNVGRGAVVDEPSLIRALQTGHLGGAGLDVFAHEPLPAGSPLWHMSNVIISPHVGGISDLTKERATRFFAVNLARYLDGHPLLNLVDRKQEY